MGRLLLLPMLLFNWSVWSQADCPNVEQDVQDFCESQGTGNYYYRPTVSHLAVTGDGREVLWYRSLEGDIALPSDYVLVDGEIYYADYKENSCGNRQAVRVTVAEAPNAGSTSHIYFCSNGEARDFYEEVKESQLGAPDRTGTFYPPLSGGNFIFDPAVDKPGQYVYTVQSTNGKCPEDYAFYNLNIIEAPNAGEDLKIELEVTEGTVKLSEFLADDIDRGGVWSPGPADGTFDSANDESGFYTYKLENENGCEDSAQIEVVVLPTVTICHHGKTMSINNEALAAHFNHGDAVGSCETPSSAKISVYPNPSSGDFNFSNKSTEIEMVRILNFKGDFVEEIENTVKSKNMEVNLGQLQKGIYFAEVITSNGKEVLRLIKK